MKPGDTIQVNWRSTFDLNPEPNWIDAVIVDMLSTQFTVEVTEKGKGMAFRFYRDKNFSWREKP